MSNSDKLSFQKLLINKWIEDNVKYPKNNSFFYAASLAALFPDLILIKGWNTDQFKNRKEDIVHFWVEDKLGNIIDPTLAQYPNGKNIEGVQISLENNMEEVIKNPLFKTLSSDDQEKILIKSSEPLSGRFIGFKHFTALLPFSKRIVKESKNHEYIGKREEESGNITYLYDEKHIAARNKKKEKRLKKLSKSLEKVRQKVKQDLTSDDDKKKLSALAIGLIDETYERIGNEESAKELKHYGVTGWLLKHITFKGNKAIIKYVGKAGVKQNKEVKNKQIVKILKDICKGKKKNDRILEGINAKDVNAYLSPFGITAKDMRGYHANKEMLRSLKESGKGKLPKDGKEREKALKERFKKALENAAKKVGHEPGTLKRQYLIPSIEKAYMEGKSTYSILASESVQFIKNAKHDGAMLALMTPPNICKKIDKIVDHDTISSDGLHLTLLYLGLAKDLDKKTIKLITKAVEKVCSRHNQLNMCITGVGLFTPGKKGTPVYFIPNAKGLNNLQADLEETISNIIDLPSEHGWVPHMTVAYSEKPEIPNIPENLTWTATKVRLQVGGNKVADFDLQKIPISKRSFDKNARRVGVKQEYIWLWDDGKRDGKLVTSPHLEFEVNVIDSQEIKGVDHLSLARKVGMSSSDAQSVIRGFVTIPVYGSPEVTTYGIPFSTLLETHPKIYNAVEEIFELVPGSYKQEILSLPHGSYEEFSKLSISKIPFTKRAIAGSLGSSATNA